MRRIPQQERGQRRVAQILAAAAEIFAEEGYEAATTNIIAARANTSIGSLYQFFPNKLAILAALASNYNIELDSHLKNTLSDAKDTSLTDMFERIIDAIGGFYLNNPGFQPLFTGTSSSKELSQVSEDFCKSITHHFERILTERALTLSREQCAFYGLIITSVLQALIPLTLNDAAGSQAEVFAELKRMIALYLTAITDEKQ